MAHTNSWDETIPTNSTNAVDIDDHIRKVRLDVRERMAVDHDISSSDSAEAEIGIHKRVTLKQAISAPTPSQNSQSIIYRNSSDHDRELRHAVKDANGTVVHDKLVFVGEIKLWLGLLANVPVGWLALNGYTVGNTGSGANYAGTVYQNLYYHLWDNLDNTAAPVSTGRGANAAADWTALKTITMPDARSKMVIGAGQASGMTLRKEGYVGGDETKDLQHGHTQGSLDVDSHYHTLTRGTIEYDVGDIAQIGKIYGQLASGNEELDFFRTTGSSADNQYPIKTQTDSKEPGVTGTTDNALTTTEDVMNPWIAIWMIIKY